MPFFSFKLSGELSTNVDNGKVFWKRSNKALFNQTVHESTFGKKYKNRKVLAIDPFYTWIIVKVFLLFFFLETTLKMDSPVLLQVRGSVSKDGEALSVKRKSINTEMATERNRKKTKNNCKLQ